MKKDSRYVWYIVDTVIFLLINLIIWSSASGAINNSLATFSWSVIILFGLGVYRLTDIATQENVTEFIRAPFMDRKIVDGKETWEISEVGIRGFFGSLLSCNACFGVWVAMIVFYSFVFFPTATFAFMIIMTLTCLEQFLSKIYNVLEKRG